jgi:hypothetical protein
MTLQSMYLGTILHLRRWQIFTIFDPYPPTIGIPAKCLSRGFLILMYCDLLTIGTWGHPYPLRHADVLNGWSLRQLAAVANKDIEKVSTNLGQAILSKLQRQMTI